MSITYLAKRAGLARHGPAVNGAQARILAGPAHVRSLPAKAQHGS